MSKKKGGIWMFTRQIKIFCVISLCFLMMVIAFTGVNATTLRVLVRPDEGKNVYYYSQQFEEKTGIKVIVDFVGWDKIHEKTLATLLAGGGGYDVVFVNSAYIGEFAATEQFEPINLDVEERSEFLPALLNGFSYKGDLVLVPWYSGGSHMIYNASYLKTAGVDPDKILTWDDFMEACRKIKEAKVVEYPFMPSCKYPGNWTYNFGTIALSMGGKFFDKDFNPIFNSGECLEALKMLEQGVKEGLFDPAGIAMDDYETLKAFEAGKTAFLIDSTWSATQTTLPEVSTVSEDARIMLIPESKKNKAFMYAGGLGIMKSSQNKAEAKQYIMFQTSKEAQMLHAILGANLPARIALLGDPYKVAISKGYSIYSDLSEQMKYGELDPLISWLDPMRKIVASSVQSALAGQKTPEEALNEAVQQVMELKKTYQ